MDVSGRAPFALAPEEQDFLLLDTLKWQSADSAGRTVYLINLAMLEMSMAALRPGVQAPQSVPLACDQVAY